MLKQIYRKLSNDAMWGEDNLVDNKSQCVSIDDYNSDVLGLITGVIITFPRTEKPANSGRSTQCLCIFIWCV